MAELHRLTWGIRALEGPADLGCPEVFPSWIVDGFSTGWVVSRGPSTSGREEGAALDDTSWRPS